MLAVHGALARRMAIALAVVCLALPTRSEAEQPVSAQAQAQARARLHFQQGKAAFELGRFQEALEQYEKAYQIAALPGFLFNIGQCHRNLGNYQKAIFSFRLYLQKKPNAPNRDAVQVLLDELEAQVATQPPTTENVPVYQPKPSPLDLPPPKPAKQRRSQPFYTTWWFWTGVAVAVAGGTAGIYFAARSRGPSIPETGFPVWDVSRSQ